MTNLEEDIAQICAYGNTYLLCGLGDAKGLNILLKILIEHTHQDSNWCICHRISYNIYDMSNHLRNKFIDLVRETNEQFIGKDKLLKLRKRFVPKKQKPRSEFTRYDSCDRKTRLNGRKYKGSHIERTIEEIHMLKWRSIFASDAYMQQKQVLSQDIL